MRCQFLLPGLISHIYTLCLSFLWSGYCFVLFCFVLIFGVVVLFLTCYIKLLLSSPSHRLPLWWFLMAYLSIHDSPAHIHTHTHTHTLYPHSFLTKNFLLHHFATANPAFVYFSTAPKHLYFGILKLLSLSELIATRRCHSILLHLCFHSLSH